MLVRKPEYYLGVASAVAEGSDCRRRRVGAVVTLAGEIVTADFNRSDQEDLSCGSGHCPRGRKSHAELPPESPYSDCIALHAEVRALRLLGELASAAGVNIDYPEWVLEFGGGQALMFVSDSPCPDCAAVLAAAGMPVIVKEYLK